MTLIKIILAICLAFTALSLVCAIWIGRRRPPAADPFFHAFGDVPGFTAEQLRAIARGSQDSIKRDPLRRSFATRDLHLDSSAGFAVRVDDAGGRGFLSDPHGPAAARKFFAPFLRALR